MDSSGNGLLVCLDDHGICAKDTEQNIHRLCSCLIKHGVIHQAPDEPSEETKRRVLPLLCALLTPSGYVILIYARMHACMYVCMYVFLHVCTCNDHNLHHHHPHYNLYYHQSQTWKSRKHSAIGSIILLLVQK